MDFARLRATDKAHAGLAAGATNSANEAGPVGYDESMPQDGAGRRATTDSAWPLSVARHTERTQ